MDGRGLFALDDVVGHRGEEMSALPFEGEADSPREPMVVGADPFWTASTTP